MDDSFCSCHRPHGLHGPQIISERYIYGMASSIEAPHHATHAVAAAVATNTVPTIDLVDNAKQLQKLEGQLYANMKEINSANPQAVDAQKALLERIASVNETKKQVFLLLQERYQDANENLSHDKLALESQMKILAIAEEQLDQVRKLFVLRRTMSRHKSDWRRLTSTSSNRAGHRRKWHTLFFSVLLQ